MKVYLVIGIILFYVGDLYTTYINLKIGNIETNTILRKLSFGGLIITKTLFLISILWIYLFYRSKKELHLEMGVLLGALLAMGIYTFFNNIGVFITK